MDAGHLGLVGGQPASDGGNLGCREDGASVVPGHHEPLTALQLRDRRPDQSPLTQAGGGAPRGHWPVFGGSCRATGRYHGLSAGAAANYGTSYTSTREVPVSPFAPETTAV